MSTLTINKTRDYDQFSFIESNREQSQGHIDNIKLAFEEYGNLTKVQPILVNDKMEIIDGQHRFTACKELGAPVYYTVAPGLGVAEARSMNILHKGWRMIDYAKSYANEGDKNYSRFLWLIKEFGFTPSVTLVYAVGNEPKGLFNAFREGNFVFPEESYEEARERLGKLYEASEVVPFVTDQNFSRALMRSMKNPDYDHKHMLKKFKLHQNMLERRARTEDYLRLIEDIYNHQLSEGRRVRLY